MCRVRPLLLAVLALSVLGSFAASAASAAPKSTSVLLLARESFPVSFSTLPTDNPNNRIPTELQNAAGTLQSAGFLAQGVITDETGGLLEGLFLGVEIPVARIPCNTFGDSQGEVLVPREDFHFVHAENAEKGSATLIVVPEFTITCGTEQIKMKGTALSSGEGGSVSGDILSLFTLGVHCSRTLGEPALTRFWSSLLSSELTALLLANFGSGFRKACEQINGATGNIHFSVSKMLEVMNP
jgi:hypothetical protein